MIEMSCPVTGSVHPQLPLNPIPRLPPIAEIGRYDSKPVALHSNDAAMPSLQVTSLPVTAGKRCGAGGMLRLRSVQAPVDVLPRNATVPPPPPSPGIPTAATSPLTENDAPHCASVSIESTPSFVMADQAPSLSARA